MALFETFGREKRKELDKHIMDTQSIEILSVSLLEQHPVLVCQLRALAKQLGLEFGWHYLLDILWIIQNLTNETAPIESLAQKRILDAGAGVGICQWFLAEQGAHVLSVDRLDRSHLSCRFRSRYAVKGFTKRDLLPIQFSSGTSLRIVLAEGWYGLNGTVKKVIRRRSHPLGSVTILHQDLTQLSEIADESMDAIVSVSALEHNQPEATLKVVRELMRVIKPGGKLLATLCAARDKDWFHEPSQGWCLTAPTLRQIFDLPNNVVDNYADYDRLMQSLMGCADLRDNLAQFYFRSGQNGMPWGKWDVQYPVVGVCKVKPKN